MNHIPQIAALLPEFGLDAMLITGNINMQYAIGQVVFSGAVLVSADGGLYITDGAPVDAQPPALDVITVSAGNVVHELARHVIQQKYLSVGYEEGTIPQNRFSSLQDALHCTLTPAQDLLRKARMKKTPEELFRIRAVQAITEQAFLETLPQLHAGLTEHAVAGILAQRMLANGGFMLAFPPIVASGPNGGNPHGFATNRVIQNGDFITMDFGVIMDGYGSDMTRTVAIGSCTDEMRHIYNTVLAAQIAGIGAAHAGVSGQEIDRAGRKVIDDAGYGPQFSHGFGHGLGIEGHEFPGAGPTDTTPLPAGAVVSAEPGIYLPGKLGVRIEDLIVITEEGCENLNSSTKELIIL